MHMNGTTCVGHVDCECLGDGCVKYVKNNFFCKWMLELVSQIILKFKGL